jgi:hypothetical protein
MDCFLTSFYCFLVAFHEKFEKLWSFWAQKLPLCTRIPIGLGEIYMKTLNIVFIWHRKIYNIHEYIWDINKSSSSSSIASPFIPFLKFLFIGLFFRRNKQCSILATSMPRDKPMSRYSTGTEIDLIELEMDLAVVTACEWFAVVVWGAWVVAFSLSSISTCLPGKCWIRSIACL